jgi:hypothetical protein
MRRRLPDVPVTPLTVTEVRSEQELAVLVAIYDMLLAVNADAGRVVAHAAGPFVHHDQPRVVHQAIHDTMDRLAAIE